MSVSAAGWPKLTSTLPWASGRLRASLACTPLGSLSSSSLGDSLLTWTMVSSSPELRSITSARRQEMRNDEVEEGKGEVLD